MTWRTTFAAKFRKNAAAARELHARARGDARREIRNVSPRALANEIGDLLKGTATWWAARPNVTRLLADLLEVEPEDLLGPAPGSTTALAFAEFPRLPPLRTHEEPCRLERSGWLLDVVLQGIERSERRWLVAPPGAGKSLVVRYLQARRADHAAAHTLTTLSEVVALADSELPLVVEIDEARATDTATLARLAMRRSATIILAPFAFPDAVYWGLEARVGRTLTGWISVDALPSGDWRGRMLDWIDERLGASERDTKLLKEHVEAWLRAHDPLGTIVATPGDLLSLCATFDLHASEEPSPISRARHWLEDVARSTFPAGTPATWLRHAATNTFVELAERHLRRTAERRGSLSRAEWNSLVPAELSPAPDADVPGAAIVIGHLRDAGLLRGSTAGLMPYPAWVERAIVTDAIGRDIEKGDASSWGALAADSTRQHVVDDAIDALPDRRFLAVLKRIAESRRPSSLAEVAAVEAAVAALGRRLDCAGFALPTTSLGAVHELVKVQLTTLTRDASYGTVHHPFTRRDIDDWFATGWSISLRVDAPVDFDRGDLTWELPGWAKQLRLENVPEHRFPGCYSAHKPVEGAAVRRVARLTGDVERLLDVGAIPARAPTLLLPALYLAWSERRWPLLPEHFGRLRGLWEEQFLAANARALAASARSALATKLWEDAANAVDPTAGIPVAERIQYLRNHHPSLLEFIVENLSEADVEATARLHGIHRRSIGANSFRDSDPLLLASLPRASRQRALRAWLESAPSRGAKFDEARELVPLLDAEDLDLALDLIRAADKSVAAEFSGFVWRTSPKTARQEARHAVENDLASAAGWFFTAPRTELVHLVEVLGAMRTPPSWAGRWAFGRVTDGGAASETLFALARKREANVA